MLTEDQLRKKKILEKFKKLDEEIDFLIKDREKQQSRLFSVTQKYTDDVSSSPQGDKFADCIANIENIEIKVTEKIDSLVDEKAKIEKAIDNIKDRRYQIILKRRYLLGEKWEKISYEINISWQHCHRLHEKALEQIDL